MTPRKRLKQTLDIGTKKALALEQKQINALVSVYKKSLADVEKKLKALYDGIGNIDAVTKRRRIQEFKSFKNQVAKALNELTGEVIKLEGFLYQKMSAFVFVGGGDPLGGPWFVDLAGFKEG